MNQKLRNGLLAAGIFLLPAIGYSQQLGGTAPDPKMLPGGGNGGSAMGSVYAPNLYDGTVNVTIPIYQYSNDAGNFGISLTYNTKGVPVDEMSSAVGLHWNIAAEGSIRRTVKGLPDEFNVPNVPDSIYEDVDTRYYAFKGRLAASFENASQAADAAVFRDSESDDFEVSAGGLSFKFNIGRDRSIFVNPDKNIKVEILSNGVPYTNVASSNPNFYDPLSLEFRVTDLQGNQYYFKRGTYDDNVMYAASDASGLPNSIAYYNLLSRWVLSEVTLANGSKIKYNYKYGIRDEYTYLSYSSKDYGPWPIASSVEKKNYMTYELSSIEYPNGVTARFVYDTLKKRLDYMENPVYPAPETGHLEGALREVRIESGNNCLRYKMDQSYTVAKGYNNQNITEVPYDGPFTVITDYLPSQSMQIVGQRTHRLRLNGIRLLSCDGNKEEPYYSFTYDATGLPCRFNSAQDYFGYYNGKQNTTEYPGQNYPDVNLTIPYHWSAVAGSNFSYGADRSEDATKIKASILTEVKNAYGGKVAFEYEGHGTALEIPLQGLPSDSFFFGKTTADGLRIRTITETDPYYPANAKITSFTYIGGQLFLTGGYFHAPGVLTSISPSSPEFGVGHWGGNWLTAHQMVNGSNHGYSQVTVVTKDNNNNLLSKKDILFTNFKDATSNNLPRYTRTAGSKHYYEFPFTDKQYLRDWEMGLPLQITDYDENGRITGKTFNNYTFSIDTTTSVTKKVDGAKASYVKDPYKQPFPDDYMWIPRTAVWDPYKPFTGKAQLTRTVIQKYVSDASYISDTVQYVYDSHSNLSSIVAYNSKGEATVTKHVYNYDVPPNVGGTILSGLEKIVSTQRWKRRPAQQDSILLDAFFNRYTNQLSGSSPVNIWSKAMYSLVTGSPLTIAQYNGTGPYNNTVLKAWAVHNGNAISDFRKATEVILYDTKGNPLETRILDQDQYKAMIWDTLTGQKLAEASNCHYNDIAFTSFEATNKGNFIYETAGVEAAPVPTAGPLSGQKMYAMNSFRPTVGMTGLNPAKTYMLTFWAKDGVPSFSGPGIASLTFTAQAQRSGWTFYAAKFTPQTSGTYNIQYNGTPIYLDEIRLFPANASMQCMTYIPLFGQGSVTDATGRITTYSYDMLGRLAVVRDQEGNIISKTQYAVHEAE